MWLLPGLLLVTAIVLSIPLSAYFAWLMDGKYHAPRVLRWFENLVDTGPQDWKQYVLALVVFNIVLFVFGFVVLCLQPIAPLNPRGLGWLEPTTIFNTVISFMTNTNLQHYSGDQSFSNFSQTFFSGGGRAPIEFLRPNPRNPPRWRSRAPRGRQPRRR